MIGTKRRRDPGILGVINKIILQAISAEITCQTFNRQRIQPEAADDLAGVKKLFPQT